MIEHEHISAKWWRWWANPLEGLHPERLSQIESQGISTKDHHRYDVVSRARRILSVPSIPDDAMIESPEKLLSVLVDTETLSARLAGLGCLVLGDSILTARNQDWEDLYGVKDNEMIRDLVSSLRSLTPVLEIIRLEILSSAPFQQSETPTLQQAIHIVLGLYFREFSLPFYARWLLTMSKDTEETLSNIQRINKEQVSEFQQWVDRRLLPLIDDFKCAHEIPLLDINELREDHAETT